MFRKAGDINGDFNLKLWNITQHFYTLLSEIQCLTELYPHFSIAKMVNLVLRSCKMWNYTIWKNVQLNIMYVADTFGKFCIYNVNWRSLTILLIVSVTHGHTAPFMSTHNTQRCFYKQEWWHLYWQMGKLRFCLKHLTYSKLHSIL